MLESLIGKTHQHCRQLLDSAEQYEMSTPSSTIGIAQACMRDEQEQCTRDEQERHVVARKEVWVLK